MRGLISHEDYKLEYFIFGSGPKTIIAFHGFNNNAHDFESIGEFAGDRYTTVSINIFFHGGSSVKERMIEKGFSREDLKTLFADIYNIRKSDKYTLLGYSLGGRIVLKLLELFPEKIEEIILMAPDGIKISPFYLFFSRTKPGRALLKRAVNDPSIFNSISEFLRKTGLVSEKKYQFAKTNFDDLKQREKVYQIWLSLRNVLSDKNDIKALLKKHNLRIHLFFGKYDKIIPPSVGRNFSKGAGKHVVFHELEEGHRMIKPDILEKVLKIVETSDQKF